MRAGDWRYVNPGQLHWTERLEPYLDTFYAVLNLAIFGGLVYLAVAVTAVQLHLAGLQVTVNAIAHEGIACPVKLQ